MPYTLLAGGIITIFSGALFELKRKSLRKYIRPIYIQTGIIPEQPFEICCGGCNCQRNAHTLYPSGRGHNYYILWRFIRIKKKVAPEIHPPDLYTEGHKSGSPTRNLM